MSFRSKSFIYRNSLSLALTALFLFCITGQAITGWHEYNDELVEHGWSALNFSSYLSSGHFVQVTFENWESEFLQMAMYVVLTIFLRQQGSSESKPLSGRAEVDRKPDSKRRNAPWPVKKGGIYLKIYQHSLSIAFALLFIVSFLLHAYGSLESFNTEQMMKGKETLSIQVFMTKSRFWFESFQNWQSEFVAVISIVVLSIFLRQKGSPESKPVDAAHSETGS